MALGASAGIAASAALTLLLSGWLGIGPTSVAASAWILLLVPAVFVWRRGARPVRRRLPLRARLPEMIGLCASAAGLWAYFSALFEERADGLYIGAMDAWADLPYHLAILEGFVKGGNVPPQEPLLAGARLAYPYLVDLHAATLVIAGLSPVRAILLQNIALSLALVILLHRFTLRVTRDRLAALLAPALLFFGGGLGFVLALKDRDPLSKLPHDYTEFGDLLHWGNPLVFWYSSMRAMLLAAPMVVAIWLFWWEARQGSAARAPRRLMIAGVIAGLLPLAHTHTFGVIVCLAPLVLPWRRLLWFLVPAGVLAFPALRYAIDGSAVHAGLFFGWSPGWMAADTGHPAVAYWLWNTGVFLPVALLGWLRGASPALRRFSLPFALCFIVPNIVRLAPWAWDSIKVLALWYLMACPLAALALARLARRGGRPGWAVAVVLLLLLTVSGALDVYRAAARQNSWRIYDPDQLAFADLVEQNTPPQSVILSAPVHNPPHQLSGRRTFLGYTGFLWTHGLDYSAREEELRTMYAGGDAAEVLLRRHRIDYVVIGPMERDNLGYHSKPLNQAYFETRFPKLMAGGHTLYDVRSLRP